MRAAAAKQFDAGNFRDAWEIYRDLALNPDDDKKEVGNDLHRAVQCLQRLGREDEADDFREKVIAAHAQDWRLLLEAARSYAHDTSHFGYIVAGKFHRGDKRGGGQGVNSQERDRVRVLQLLEQALPLVAKETDRPAASGFYIEFANQLLNGRGYRDAWELQALTDLSRLPDFEDTPHFGWWRGNNRNPRGAPVDADGNPIFHKVPESYGAAKSDGERWRWSLEQASQADSERTNEVRMLFAKFLEEQFDVATLRYFGRFFGPQESDDPNKDESGPYAMHTLGQDETIARMATGVKRFKLPDEFNFISIYQSLANQQNSYGEQALAELTQVFENRRQYDVAAEYLRTSIKQFGAGSNNHKRERLNQIVGNWGRFEPISVQPAGRGGAVEFRFRNGKKVSFEAQAIKVDKLLDDVKSYLKSRPRRLEWDQVNISELGYRLVTRNQSQYLGEKVANWTVDLEPREKHFDKRVTITTPLQKPGAYLLTGTMESGNKSRIIVWIADTAIVRKPLNNAAYYFVADAVTGKPIEKAHLEFFGFWNEHIQNNNYQIRTSQFAEYSDADGQVIPNPKQLDDKYQWVVIARTPEGRFAYDGFEGVWYGRTEDYEFNETKVFVTTDRPVYRPEQTLKFKFWVRHAKYDQEDVSDFVNQQFTVQIMNPMGEKILEKGFKSDKFGGFEGEFAIPASATLGQYSISLVNSPGSLGGGTFRVEEYKKPEFEVTVEAPTEPVALGDKLTATVRAKYYFGAPVTNASVHYTVKRTNHNAHWYPVGIWDWFYGPWYWWYAYDYDWFPGWRVWGCVRPYPFWFPHRSDPPEVVLDNTVPVGEDGTVKIEIDTAFAKAIHGDLDHKYEITAEVVDQSRRTIVGNGQVLVARSPFKVFSWVDRGHYRTGDVVRASFKSQTLDQKPVAGKGVLTLNKITYDEKGTPTETAVETWNLDANDRGEAQQQIKAADPGQYRLSYKVTNSKGHTVEGGYVFVVMGQGSDGSEFRFNDIELVTDKREYAPGETVRVMVNTNRVGGTVVLFLRPTNGVYSKPQILRLTGKSTIHEVAVVKKDIPNFFIEAFTVSGG
ncbi:MAG: MG2 domain-containing protein, partial [Planctomycetaceae bacterium]